MTIPAVVAGGLGLLAVIQAIKGMQQPSKESRALNVDKQKRQLDTAFDIMKDEKSTPDQLEWAEKTYQTFGIPMMESFGQRLEDSRKNREYQRGMQKVFSDLFSRGMQQRGIQPSGASTPSAPMVQPQSAQKSPSLSLGKGAARTQQIQQMIVQEAQSLGVDPAEALSLAHIESRFNPSAKSPKGALGIMQLMPETAKGLGVDPNDVQQNIRGGLTYYKQMMDQFQDPVMARAAYNAGPGAVQQYGGVPPFAETQQYVKSFDEVLPQYAQYSQQGQQSQMQFPSAQYVPEIGELPPLQQGMADDALRSLDLKMNADGSFGMSFKPFAAPSIDEQLGAMLQQQSPEFRRALSMMMLMGKAGLAPQMQFRTNEVTGNGEFVYMDPFTMKQVVVPTGKIQMTPEEQQEQEIQTAERKATADVMGKEIGRQRISQFETGRVNKEFEQRTKELPAGEQTTLAGASASVREIGAVMRTLKKFTGTDAKGAINMDKVPVGVFETTAQNLNKRFGISEQYTGLMRENLNSLTAAASQILFSLGGKNLTESEQKALEALRVAIDESPQSYFSRLSIIYRFIKNRAEGLKDSWEGRDTRAVDTLLKVIKDNDFMKDLPQAYRDVFGEGGGETGAPAAASPAAPNLDDLYNNTVTGKGKK